jgi:adenosylcobinamide kinase / adenosylcobinamide-phosphate guanylyltransferase
MGALVLITGGSRSGKSSLAQRMGEALPAPRTYVATSQLSDDEWAERIARHQADRVAGQWATVEEPAAVPDAVRALAGSGVVMVDCVTVWVNNLIWAAAPHGLPANELEPEALQSGKSLPSTLSEPEWMEMSMRAAAAMDEDDIAAAADELLGAARSVPGVVILVTNEVGTGIVPMDPVGRRFRDLVGRCNQVLAADADLVVLTVCGLPMVLKGADHELAALVR